MNPEQAFIQAIKSNLNDDQSPEEIERTILEFGNHAAEVSSGRVQEIAKQFRDEAALLQSATSRSLELPRLLVDWGEGIHVGGAACPEFHIVCPDTYRGQPRVDVKLDPRIDFDPQFAVPEVNDVDDARHWSFDVPFFLTTNGEDCRPGSYRLQLRFRFPTSDASHPRYFTTKIRITVHSTSSLDPKTLEIHGDGDALLNLRGRDLGAYGRIIMKCSDRGVINVEEPLFPVEVDQPLQSPEVMPEETSTKFEYTLRPDHVREERIPRPSHRFQERAYTDCISLVSTSGKRTLLLSRNPIALGRDRCNDIVLRFLPRDEHHDKQSLNISRTHLMLALRQDGLCVEDQNSSKGTMLDQATLQPSVSINNNNCGKRIPLSMAACDEVGAPLQLQVELFSFRNRAERVDADYCEGLDAKDPDLWMLAREAGLSALRISRLNNLIEEEYIAVFHSAVIGSGAECAIRIEGEGVKPEHARVLHLNGCFWMENLTAFDATTINGLPLPKRELVPLTPDSVIRLGDMEYRCETWRQEYL